MTGDRQQFTITALGHQGDGRSEDGRFLPGTLPGETVSACATADGWSDIRIETPSSDRVRPPCRHARTCGGCRVQHGSDDLVARWKQQMVADALAQHGLSPDFRPIETSPIRSRRRAGVAARRTKSGAMAGFHRRGDHALVDITDCPILDPQLQDGLPVARALAVVGASRKSELGVQMTCGMDGLDISVSGGKVLDDTLRRVLPETLSRFPVTRLTWDGEPVFQTTAPRTKIAGLPVPIPPGAFLQATAHGETILQTRVAEIIGNARKIADLFAGCGTFTLALAQGRQLHAVEAERPMLDALTAAARAAGKGFDITTLTRNLFAEPLLPGELNEFDAAIIDPPRAGAAAQSRELAASNLTRLAYVSCDPASFARDAAVLVDGGFTLDWVQVVDQFRWSAHVELVACFKR